MGGGKKLSTSGEFFFYRTDVENTNKLVLAGEASYSYDRGNL